MARPKAEDVIKEIDELTEKLGLDKIDTTGFEYSDLSALVKDLRAKIEDAENVTEADKAEADADANAKAEAAKALNNAKAKMEVSADDYVVANGKAVTCIGKRIKANGAPITVDDIGGNAKAFETLIDRKFVVKK